MKRLKRFFNKKFKRYSFVFLTLITCVVVLSTPVTAEEGLSNLPLLKLQNVENCWAINPYVSQVNFFDGQLNGSELSLPLGVQSTNWIFFNTPIARSERSTSQQLSDINYQKYKSFSLELKFLQFGVFNTHTAFHNSLKDDERYYLSFDLRFYGCASNSNSFAPYSFIPNSDYKFFFYFSEDGSTSVNTLKFYELKTSFTKTVMDNGKDIYGTYSCYCEIPGSLLKNAYSLVISGVDNNYARAYIQFGIPKSSGSYTIGYYDPLTAPVYAVPYSNQIHSMDEAEDMLRSQYIDTSFNSVNNNLSSLTSVFQRNRNTFLACSRAIDNFTNIGFVGDILISIVSVSVFVILFKMGVNNL